MTAEWRKKAPRTRQDWDRGWGRIDPLFGDIGPRTVSLEDVSAMREHIETTVSRREAHRVIKIWRALWSVSSAMHYCDRERDPSLGIRNSAAKGRTENLD